jgi:hypothetical protein
VAPSMRLGEHAPMADVVFILGAGCSAHCGAPLMANFLDRARDLFLQKAVEDRRPEFEKVFDVVNGLQQVHSKAQLDLQNIESVFSAVDLARTLKKLPGIPTDEIDGALSSLVWLIVRTLEESTNFKAQNGYLDGTTAYRALATLTKALATKAHPPLSSAILTFNYDIALDVSLHCERVPFTYGLDGAVHGLPLLKLHGSLNWVRGIANSEIRAYPIGPLLEETRELDGRDVRTARVTEHVMKKSGNQVEPQPVLVPPTWSKGEHYRGIEKVWARAAHELGEARYVFIIGYSLPPTDQFFRLLFALGAQGKVPLTRIDLFDPNAEEVSRRFEEFLGHAAIARFTPYQSPFSDCLVHIRRNMGLP